MNRQKNSLTEGNIVKGLLIFAFPILIGNIFQQLYNVVDTAIIGNVLGDRALAAIGATSALYMLVIGFANGITNGFSVVLARAYGENDEDKIKETVSLIYVLTLGLSLVLTLLSVFGLHGVLVTLKTPSNIINETEAYLRMIFTFSTVTMLFNMFSSILRAVGDSRTPLYFLVVASLLNVGLDIIFVKVFEMGIRGAAIATIIAQVISVALCIIYVWVKCPMLGFHAKSLRWNKELFGDLVLTGFSMGLMLVVVSIGSVALQSAVNSLGEHIIAAHTAARKLDDIFMLPLGTLATASATFASQNLGAKKYDRIHKGIKAAMMLAVGWSVISVAGVFVFGRPMVKLLTGSEDYIIIENAIMYMKINIIFFFVLSVLLILRSSLQGVGRKLVPVMGSVVELVFKFGAVNIISDKLGYFGVCILEPIIWIICGGIVFLDFIVFQKKLRNIHSKKATVMI